MEKRKDNMEQFIKEELKREAEEIRRENISAQSEGLSDETRLRIRGNLQKEIEEYEWKRRYPELSGEERRALRLGQELISGEHAGEADSGTEETAENKEGYRRVRKKRGARFYIALAAVLIMTLAVGVSAMGGPERVVKIMKGLVGEREVTQVDSGEDNLVIAKEDEEEAYQLIREVFGVDSVKIHDRPVGMVFDSIEMDEELQIAQLTYFYNEKMILYVVNTSYRASSLGIDIEDEITDQYELTSGGCVMSVTEYEKPESKMKRYAASFQYKGLEYYLAATMEKEEFELILKNLIFYN